MSQFHTGLAAQPRIRQGLACPPGGKTSYAMRPMRAGQPSLTTEILPAPPEVMSHSEIAPSLRPRGDPGANSCPTPVHLFAGALPAAFAPGSPSLQSPAEKHGTKFKTVLIDLEDRDHAKLWIEEHQVGRRNITDDQRSVILDSIRERRADFSRQEAAKEREKEKAREDKTASPAPKALCSRCDTLYSGKGHICKAKARTAVAKEFKIPERKLRTAQEIKKAEPKLSEMVRSSEITLLEAKKLAVLPAPARKIAIAAVEDGKDVRTAQAHFTRRTPPGRRPSAEHWWKNNSTSDCAAPASYAKKQNTGGKNSTSVSAQIAA